MEINPTSWKINVTSEQLWVIKKSIAELKYRLDEDSSTWGKPFVARLNRMHEYLKEYKLEW